MISPWLGIGLVLVILAALLAALGGLNPRHHPEVARKALHVGMGLVTLSFPWLFAQTWPVLVLACLAMLLFIALRTHPALGQRLGGAIYRVPRASLGEIYFALGTGVVFTLSAGNALMFCVPMLVLTFADAAAALIGTRYGRHREAAWRGEKTLAGSAAFFIVALACIYLPISWLAPTHSAANLAAALFAAALATGIEAVAGGGLDNLLVPAAVFAALAVSDPSYHDCMLPLCA